MKHRIIPKHESENVDGEIFEYEPVVRKIFIPEVEKKYLVNWSFREGIAVPAPERLKVFLHTIEHRVAKATGIREW